MQNKIYVGNLSYGIEEQELRNFFSSFGNITEVFIPKDRETGKGRGFAFVTFENQAQAQEAANKTNGQELTGRVLKVNIAKEREEGGSRSGGGSRGGRTGSGSRY